MRRTRRRCGERTHDTGRLDKRKCPRADARTNTAPPPKPSYPDVRPGWLCRVNASVSCLGPSSNLIEPRQSESFDEVGNGLCDLDGLGLVSRVPPAILAEGKMTQADMYSNVRPAAQRTLRPPITAGSP